jgi:integrase
LKNESFPADKETRGGNDTEKLATLQGVVSPTERQKLIKAGSTKPAQIITTPAKMEQEILDFKLDQQKNGRAEETVRARIQTLRQVSQICDIDDPEIVKLWLADQKNEHHFTKACTWNNSTKNKFIETYTIFLHYIGKTWTPPKYAINEKLPFIPTEQEIDILIAGSRRMLAAILQTLKETGMRIGELTQLTTTHIDTERKIVNITPEKGSNPRILPISDKLIAMMNNLPHYPSAHYKTIFQSHKNTLRGSFCKKRKQLATRFNNPRLLQISFHTLRHWKGTMEYHATKDILHVKQILGHKSIMSTMIYINLEAALFNFTDEWTCKTAKTPEEAIQLIQTGFEKADTMGEIHIYRKRK